MSRLLGLEDPYSHTNLIEIYSTIYHWAGSRMNILQVSPISEYGNPAHKYFNVSDEDAVILKMQFPELVTHKWHDVISPHDDQEVRVMCRRCNGYVFSVSGYEWKEDAHYRVYNCTPQTDGTCQYE